jgi:hypothetical protein
MPNTRRPPSNSWISITLSKEHAAITANGSAKLYSVKTGGRALRVERVAYLNPTGLAADATNAFRLELKNGSTVVAAIANTDSDDVPAGAAIPTNTFVEGTVVAAARVLQPGAVLDITFTEDGTATLPAGTVIIEGFLV